jgi:oligopeptide/dipeptide ABC transporter ATP-binding protein
VSAPLLRVRALEVEHAGGARALRGVDLELERGRCLALVGESGSGKSSLALAVLRLLPQGARMRAAALELDGRDLLALGEPELDALRGARMGLVLQDPTAALDPLQAVGAQVGEAWRLCEGLGRAAARARGIELLERVGLPEPARLWTRFPHELSGGQRQRVALAMALARRPALLVADEPTTALDALVQARLLALLRELVEREGLGLLWITHDLGVVAQISDETAVLYAGRVVERGPTADVLRAPAHPYTAALVAAHPSRSARGELPRPIPGRPADAAAMPAGCAFHPRCAIARPQCARDVPELAPFAGAAAGRAAACPWAGPGGAA